MSKLVKLNEGHLEEIYRRSAIGEKPAAIAKELEAGLVNEAGDRLPPVTVTRSNVRYHVISVRGQQAIEAWRVKLYGDVRRLSSSCPAWRLGELERLYEEARKGLEAESRPEGDGRAARAWAKLAGDYLEKMHRHCETVRPRERPEGTKHLHLHGAPQMSEEEYGELVGELAGRLLELSDAGLLEGRLAPMLPVGDAIDQTGAGGDNGGEPEG